MVLVSGTITLARVVDGQKGEKGETGADGRTQYLHIKYSDDGATFTANSGETLGAYIGTLVDFNELDSTTFSDYTWKKFTEDVDAELEDLRQSIVTSSVTVEETSKEYTVKMLESYVEKDAYETFKSETENQIELTKEGFDVKLSERDTSIDQVNEDLQQLISKIEKHFLFRDNGLIITSGNNSIKLRLDTDFAGFYQGEVDEDNLENNRFTTFNPEAIKTPNLYVDVDKIAQFGNYAFVPFNDESEEIDGLDLVRVGE